MPNIVIQPHSAAKRSIIGSALLYFILSTDIIPDYVFPFGYLDDTIADPTCSKTSCEIKKNHLKMFFFISTAYFEKNKRNSHLYRLGGPMQVGGLGKKRASTQAL